MFVVWLHNWQTCSSIFFTIAFFKYVYRFGGVANVLTSSDVSKLSLKLFCVILSSLKEDRRASPLLVLTIFLVPRSGFPSFSDLYNSRYAWSYITTFSSFSFKQIPCRLFDRFLARTVGFFSNCSPIAPCGTTFSPFFNLLAWTKETIIQVLRFFRKIDHIKLEQILRFKFGFNIRWD